MFVKITNRLTNIIVHWTNQTKLLFCIDNLNSKATIKLSSHYIANTNISQ